MSDSTDGIWEPGDERQAVIVVGLDAAQLLANDASPSMHAAAYAAGLARQQGARLIAVWVRPSIAIGDLFASTAETIADQRRIAAARLGQSVRELGEESGGPTTRLLIRDGDPFRELTAVADEVHADAIVVGASAQPLGSLASRLAKRAPRPVMVIP